MRPGHSRRGTVHQRDQTDLGRRQQQRERLSGRAQRDRSERIRTYNYPQNRCTDHRVNQNYPLDKVAVGELDAVIADLRKLDRQRRLQAV